VHRTVFFTLPCLLAGQGFSNDRTQAFVSAKDWPGLEAWSRSLLQANPNEAKNHLLLGMALANQGRAAEAAVTFRRATALEPTKVEGWFNLCLAGAQVADHAITTEGLDGVATRHVTATRRLLDLDAVKAVLGSDLPASQEDFSRIRVKYQPPAPPYPDGAKINRVQGTVVVEITQDRDGRVVKVRSLEGPEALRETAASYAACWRFFPIPPERKDDRLSFRLTMPFRLR
jgi:TonB family protein